MHVIKNPNFYLFFLFIICISIFVFVYNQFVNKQNVLTRFLNLKIERQTHFLKIFLTGSNNLIGLSFSPYSLTSVVVRWNNNDLLSNNITIQHRFSGERISVNEVMCQS